MKHLSSIALAITIFFFLSNIAHAQAVTCKFNSGSCIVKNNPCPSDVSNGEAAEFCNANASTVLQCTLANYDCPSAPPPGGGGSGPSAGIFCDGGNGIQTAIGCINFTSFSSLQIFFQTWGIGVASGVAFILIALAGYQIMTSQGDPRRLQGGKELLFSAIAGIILLVFAALIIRIIATDILNIL